MIVWYGERGVVNAMVTHLDSDIDRGRQFLRAIQWMNDNGVPDWVEEVTELTYIVELGLAHFGNPDLILVCKCKGEEQPRCVLVEAKVVPYAASAVCNNPGMQIPGYNSSINGQLALKYRFANAANGAVVVEPEPIHHAYQEVLGDPQNYPRRLLKPQVINVLQQHGLLGLPLDHFSFVALTWDTIPFFGQDGNPLPRFLDGDGNDLFGQMTNQVGWLNYQHLAQPDGLNCPIDAPLALMGLQIAPPQPVAEGQQLHILASEAIARMDAELQQIVQQLQDVAVRKFGQGAVNLLAGSISVRSPVRVEAKIVPKTGPDGAHIYLGIRPEWPLDEWSGHLQVDHRRFALQHFQFIRVPVGQAIGMAEQVLEQLHEVLNQEPDADER